MRPLIAVEHFVATLIAVPFFMAREAAIKWLVMRERLGWKILDASNGMYRRPRGGWIAFEMQMIVHGLFGNGWHSVLLQLRDRIQEIRKGQNG